MKKHVLFVVFLLISLCTFSQEVLTTSQLQEDFDQFKEELIKRNKGLYLFVSEEDFATHLADIESQLNQEMNTLEFMKLLKQAIIPVQERHLSVQGFHKKSEVTKKSKGYNGDTIKLFPLRLQFMNDSLAFIIRDARKDSSIHLPSKILSVNGKSILEIRNELAKYITEDQGVDTWKNWELSRRFALSYYYNIDTTSVFKVEWKHPGGENRESLIKGVSIKQYRDSINAQSKEIFDVKEFKDIWRYEIIDSSNIGYLRIGTFSEKKLKNGDKKLRYKSIVKDFFEQVHQSEVDHIIIDLRNNNGGSVNLLKYLFSYIQPTTEKQVMYDRLKDRDWWFGEVERESKTDRQRQPHFSGKTYVMTNGGSYSAAVMFPVLAKQYVGATIVGTPVGGRPNGTTAGSFHIERLKHSNIIVRIPESVFTYTDDPTFNVQPDIIIEPKIGDYFSYESDHMLDQLLEMITNGH